jgi:hypothetical protein
MKRTLLYIRNILLVSLIVLLSACEKKCNCGIVKDDGIETDPTTFDSYYWVTIENSCSGNVKKFYLPQDAWYDAQVGSDFCISNVTSW